MTSNNNIFVYIGAYTSASAVGITVASLDPATGRLGLVESCEGLRNPTFLAFNRACDRLYAVCETEDHDGMRGGAVASFRIDPGTGRLDRLNVQPTGGSSPCHLSLDLTGSLLFVANYSSGSVSVLPLEKDGTIGPVSGLHQHLGSGPIASRQSGPHAHSIFPDWNNRFALSADLGTDRIVAYRIDTAGKRLVPHSEAALHPGAGPRHIAFFPKGSMVYVINELDSTVTAMRYDAETGGLTPRQTLSALPAGYQGESWCAEIVLSPDGRFLYASNRGHDSVAVFAVDPAAGTLALAGHSPTLGRNPRNFALSPDGGLLIAANQDSDTVRVFSRETSNGLVSDTGHSLAVSKPVCVRVRPFA
jgi:6-phosphogluconolactonase